MDRTRFVKPQLLQAWHLVALTKMQPEIFTSTARADGQYRYVYRLWAGRYHGHEAAEQRLERFHEFFTLYRLRSNT
jgi:hypothetical protein